MEQYNKGKGEAVAWIRSHANFSGDECLIWPFCTNGTGYGRFGVDGKGYYAHIFMCDLVHGPKPTAKHEASHSCNNGQGGCVNPRHLLWETRRENQLRRRANGTNATNTRGSAGKLTLVQKKEIMALKGQKPQREIAKIYGVHFQTISRIHMRGINRNPKFFSFQPEEDAALKKCKSLREAATVLNRSYASVQSRARRLKILVEQKATEG